MQPDLEPPALGALEGGIVGAVPRDLRSGGEERRFRMDRYGKPLPRGGKRTK